MHSQTAAQLVQKNKVNARHDTTVHWVIDTAHSLRLYWCYYSENIIRTKRIHLRSHECLLRNCKMRTFAQLLRNGLVNAKQFRRLALIVWSYGAEGGLSAAPFTLLQYQMKQLSRRVDRDCNFLTSHDSRATSPLPACANLPPVLFDRIPVSHRIN